MEKKQQFSAINLIPVPEWPKYHIWPPIGGLRHLIFNSRTNGFEKVIKRIGRRILIDESEFFKWVQLKNPQYQGGANA